MAKAIAVARADIEVHPMRWRLRLSHGVNQEIHSMAISHKIQLDSAVQAARAKFKYNLFYNCREFSTNRPFIMQNKPNFLRSQMNVSSLLTMDYENKSNWTLGENKPNSNPIKANFKKAKMNLNFYSAKDCEKGPRGVFRKNKANPSTSLRTGLSTRLPSGLSLRVEDKTGQSQSFNFAQSLP